MSRCHDAAMWLLKRPGPTSYLLQRAAGEMLHDDPRLILRALVEQLDDDEFSDLLVALGIARGWVDVDDAR